VQAGVSERDLPRHLEHLRKSLRQEGLRLAVSPAKCLGCGFVFAKRDRLSKPGRCPVCKGTRVAGPEFSVE
jgi:predicted Zn-ribbon and HTH transcriptional regulator